MSARWTQADVDALNCKSQAKRVAAQTGLKYGNVKTGSYASKREAKRAAELKALETTGHIAQLREQVKFELIPTQQGERACSYVADFVFLEPSPNDPTTLVQVVEDVKGYANAVYRIKKKLMLHVHGIRVRES